MDELAERIAARLNEALDRSANAEFLAGGDRGLALGPANGGQEADIVLSVEDVARIAADEARAWL